MKEAKAFHEGSGSEYAHIFNGPCAGTSWPSIPFPSYPSSTNYDTKSGTGRHLCYINWKPDTRTYKWEFHTNNSSCPRPLYKKCANAAFRTAEYCPRNSRPLKRRFLKFSSCRH